MKRMKQWIIDRYHKGGGWKSIYLKDGAINCHGDIDQLAFEISLYDFLFNPKWGFAKAFWGEKPALSFIKGIDYFYQANLMEMSIHPKPLEYLESFKETT